jgi:hypothetical protein
MNQSINQSINYHSHFFLPFLFIFFFFSLFQGPGYPGPRCTVIGLQMFFISSLGFYIWLSNHKATTQLTLVISKKMRREKREVKRRRRRRREKGARKQITYSLILFSFVLFLSLLVFYTLMCLLGNVSILSHDQPIWTVSYATCLTYFIESDGFNRCDDSGYLQLIRTFGVFTIIVLSAQFMQLFSYVTSNDTIVGGGGVEGEGRHEPLNKQQQEQQQAYQASYVPPQQQQQQQTTTNQQVGQGYQAL